MAGAVAFGGGCGAALGGCCRYAVAIYGVGYTVIS